MDRETLMQAIDQGPIRVHMHGGSSFEIADHKACAIDDMTAYVMYRDEASGKYKARWLALVCMARIEQVTVAS